MKLLHSLILIPCSLLAFTNASAQETAPVNYPAVIGDIEYDPAIDDPGFKVCHVAEVYQYYTFGKGVQFKGEKPAIVGYFQKKYKGSAYKGENGYVTIRFVVNCEGSAGRYRVQEMDFDFQPKSFSKTLVNQLLTLTQSLQGWLPAIHEGHAFDYYQYLTFKIEDGMLTEILP